MVIVGWMRLGQVTSMDVEQRSDHLTVEVSDGKTEIHFQDNTITNGPLHFTSWETTNFDEYITIDGGQVSYQKVNR